MWAFHFQTRPLLSLEDARAQEAKSTLDWHQLYSSSTRKPPFPGQLSGYELEQGLRLMNLIDH
jgi:hypothetical protein